jgi:hypothetical protein
MSAALLAKLKIKKQPDVLEKVELVIPAAASKEDITIKTKIVDKSKIGDFDRAAFLNTLTEKQEVVASAEPVTALAEPVTALAEPVTALAEPAATVEQTILTIKKPVKKILKKLTIVEETEPSAAPAPAPAPASAPAAAEETAITIVKGKKVIKRKTKEPIGVIQEGPLSMLKIGDTIIHERLGLAKKDSQILISASSYYMNNRKIFTNFMSSLFGKYKKELITESENATCSYDENEAFSLMTHQKIVRDYLNLITPYRGVLLYHGLGSGKTCSSIAIAEGMKSTKQIIVMTPASLRMNYIEELKKCGDSLYRKNQFWEFINIGENPELLNTLSNLLSLSIEYLRTQGGAWLSNITKPSNYDTLAVDEKTSLDNQLNEMIRYKYKFINYNGLRKSHLAALTNNYTKNMFDNSVIIIDEAHNFVSRIVNKLTKKETLSGMLYEYLMNAHNAKIILLTGTPIINYPNEIAILFNILRGKIKTWYFKLTVGADAGAGPGAAKKISQEFFHDLFKTTILGANVLDYMEYKPTSTTLVITRNPFGFINKTKDYAYDGVRISERGDMNDDTFVKYITKLLENNNIKVVSGGIRVELYKALPDNLDEFKNYFIDATNEVKNMNLFKRRILGLPSYFRSAQEGLMPRFEKSKDFHIVKIEMSDFQLSIYEEARAAERELERQNAKKKKKKTGTEVYEDAVSTYRIFSRAFCNFVFPRPAIRRPMPKGDENLETAIMEESIDENILDATSADEKLEQSDGIYDADDIAELEAKEIESVSASASMSYQDRINTALKELELHKKEYLTPDALQTYSPKMLNILENIKDEHHIGLHLVYSQFRTLEGIGILKLVLEANGFAQFKIKKIGEEWQMAMTEDEMAKPKFALYTGTETAQEKEIIRNVFNGAWKYIPETISSKIQAIAANNMYGEIIKVLMITSSGAEGISLKNVRYVHITEPYWHPVRTEQVIGRARRICSHQELPEELRTVEVFLYLMVFSKEQLKTDICLPDKSKIDNLTRVTTDEALYEIATIKENITNKILNAVKEASFDCALHSKAGAKEQLQCFSFGKVNSDKFSYYPSIAEEESDVIEDKNKVTITWQAVDLELNGIKYALKQDTGEVYDLDSYIRGQPVQVGTLVTIGKGKGATYKFEHI